MAKKILVVEDERNILQLIVDNLIDEGYEALTAKDGQTAINIALTARPDLIILDLNLPVKTGEEVCMSVRKKDRVVPIIMLTVRKRDTDKVSGLKLGADDYMTKPFSIQELLARIEAHLRRGAVGKQGKDLTQHSFGDVKIDFIEMESSKKGKRLKFTKRQYDILRYLIQRKGEAVSREDLLTRVWNYEEDVTTRTVDNFIYDIRKKIEDNPSNPKHIIGIHSVGYKFIG